MTLDALNLSSEYLRICAPRCSLDDKTCLTSHWNTGKSAAKSNPAPDEAAGEKGTP
eukprot:CAMPEP_0173413510 /NCGR_PEP_ID=MMETSP1356-20130122/82267_1 /TAXON_ID=77927 ORGANISM="Hemiselmis virescens, Strain PCC157" /NCGR_SAMPLE_ID=MMETSP1356 /ASSEMBLY_ACC=CAM_ASM_000847 /LENGTH=55 /DNA_ID=CAMNT_0014375561 /DNA_START=183 /DNA_END=348 /DNA_ORIENTATION=+